MKILYTKWGDVSKEDFENIQELEAQEVQDGLKNHHGDFLKDLVITGRLAKLSEMYFQLGMRPQAVFVGEDGEIIREYFEDFENEVFRAGRVIGGRH